MPDVPENIRTTLELLAGIRATARRAERVLLEWEPKQKEDAMPEHSPEPWAAGLGDTCQDKCSDDCRENSGLTDADGSGILWACSCCEGVHARKANLERIAANSRALANVPDPEKLMAAVKEMIAYYNKEGHVRYDMVINIGMALGEANDKHA